MKKLLFFTIVSFLLSINVHSQSQPVKVDADFELDEEKPQMRIFHKKLEHTSWANFKMSHQIIIEGDEATIIMKDVVHKGAWSLRELDRTIALFVYDKSKLEYTYVNFVKYDIEAYFRRDGKHKDGDKDLLKVYFTGSGDKKNKLRLLYKI